MPTHTTTSFTGDPMESAVNDTHDKALARILTLQALVREREDLLTRLKREVEAHGAQIDVAVAAHHAALRNNEAMRKDRDDACERASRLSKQLVEADLAVKRLENARGLWKQRAERLIQQRRTVFGQRMRRIQHALGLPYDSSLKDIAEHVERLADVGLNYREAEGDLSKVRDELRTAREQIREAAKNVAQSADLEYQRKEQGRLARELSDAGAELHEARRKLVEADETNRVCVNERIKLAAKVRELEEKLGVMGTVLRVEGHTHQDARGLVRAADARATRAAELRLGAEAQAAHFLAEREKIKTAADRLVSFLWPECLPASGKPYRCWIGYANLCESMGGNKLLALASDLRRATWGDKD